MAANKTELLKQKIAEAAAYETDFLVGLNDEQVQSRIDDGLVNKSKKTVTKTTWQILKDNVFTFFNIIFFIICIILIIARADLKNFFFILPVSGNIVLGLVADFRARALVNKLSLVTNPRQSVMRNEKEIMVASDEIVLSDIIVLRAGDQVCADAIVVGGKASFNESSITGESDSISKEVGDEILSGTYVVSGLVYARVIRIGAASYIEGVTAAARNFSRPKSEIKMSCLYVFRLTGTIAIVFAIAMTVIWLFKSEISYESFSEFATTFAGSLVAMIPAGLYLLSSITLGIGVINLGRKQVNVQELFCIETLARADVICFDKTGTLTDGTLTIKELYNYSNMSDEDIKDRMASLVASTKDTNGTASAISSSFGQGKNKAVAVIPFDSAYKYSAATFENGETYVLGAYGFVDAKPVAEIEQMIKKMAAQGERAVCFYRCPKPLKNDKISAKCELIAVLDIADHIKEDASDNIDWFISNGVDVKVISGDDPITVAKIANQVGVPHAANYVSMDGVTLQEIPELVKNHSVFGRVSPTQKEAIVSALQAQGHKVAMTGDGVNDILALKKADCSICMASGSSAARNSAHMIVMDNTFSHLPDVVAEGRRVVNNLQRTSSLFLSKTVFAIIMSLVFMITNICGGPSYPFTTSNMILWETITIGGGGFLLALEPSKEPITGTFLGNVAKTALVAGGVETLSVLVIYLAYLIVPDLFMSSRTVVSTVAVYVFSIISYLVLFKNCLKLNRYRATVFIALVVVGVAFLVADYFVFGFLSNLVKAPGGRGGGSEYLSIYHWVVMIADVAVMSIIYVLISLFVDKTYKKKMERKNEN